MAQRPLLGLTLPIRKGKTGYFEQTSDILVQARSNLANLLLTGKGERIFQPTFGCNIHGILFDELTPAIEGNLKNAIQEAVQTWTPFIVIQSIQLSQDIDSNKIAILIAFGTKTSPTTDTITLVI